MPFFSLPSSKVRCAQQHFMVKRKSAGQSSVKISPKRCATKTLPGWIGGFFPLIESHQKLGFSHIGSLFLKKILINLDATNVFERKIKFYPSKLDPCSNFLGLQKSQHKFLRTTTDFPTQMDGFIPFSGLKLQPAENNFRNIAHFKEPYGGPD